MAAHPVTLRGLKLQRQENANQTIVYCTGEITAENSGAFQKQIRDLIPESPRESAGISYRIVLDLSNVTHVDSSGMGALLGVWTAAKTTGCDLEIANPNPRVEKLLEITNLDALFTQALSPQDPEEACQQALDAGMLVHRADPLNCETPLPGLIDGLVTPNARFYVRNHFQVPRLDPSNWRLQVMGLVERPLNLNLSDLMKMPCQTRFATLECAGNGRALLNPRVSGEQWNLGAVSTAEWTGVPLAEVLDRAGVKGGAREIVFRGADCGQLDESSEPIRFERSLSVDDAQRSEALLAYAMNGETLPIQHGYPLRIIVPGWYAVASVKWLTEIEAISGQFRGHYQTETYVFEWERGEQIVREPVSLLHVRSLITEPAPGSTIGQGELPIRGVAWSGAAPIARVEVRIGDGPWQDARLVGGRKPYSWQPWELIARVEQPGSTVISARATDLANRTQPDSPEWNRLGYGNNAIVKVRVDVR